MFIRFICKFSTKNRKIRLKAQYISKAMKLEVNVFKLE